MSLYQLRPPFRLQSCGVLFADIESIGRCCLSLHFCMVSSSEPSTVAPPVAPARMAGGSGESAYWHDRLREFGPACSLVRVAKLDSCRGRGGAVKGVSIGIVEKFGPRRQAAVLDWRGYGYFRGMVRNCRAVPCAIRLDRSGRLPSYPACPSRDAL